MQIFLYHIGKSIIPAKMGSASPIFRYPQTTLLNGVERPSILNSRLFPVVFLAKHLTVRGDGLAAFTPWSDVVGFHLVDLEMFFAHGTDSFLPFVGLTFLIGTESSNAQVPFVPR